MRTKNFIRIGKLALSLKLHNLYLSASLQIFCLDGSPVPWCLAAVTTLKIQYSDPHTDGSSSPWNFCLGSLLVHKCSFILEVNGFCRFKLQYLQLLPPLLVQSWLDWVHNNRVHLQCTPWPLHSSCIHMWQLYPWCLSHPSYWLQQRQLSSCTNLEGRKASHSQS